MLQIRSDEGLNRRVSEGRVIENHEEHLIYLYANFVAEPVGLVV